MRTRKLYVFMLAVAAVLTACTNEDNFTNEQLPNTGNEAHTFTVNIPASMGEGAQTRAVTFDNTSTPPTATGSFAASEPVYVYNETKKALLTGVLHPSNISADGKLCNLEGTLTGTVDASDKLTLLYNMIYDTDPAYCFFDYNFKDGSESGVVDGGMATGVSATISGGTLTTATTVTFAMQQAIFRLKFTDGTNPITVKSLKCTGSDVFGYYYPFADESSQYKEQSIVVMPTTPTSDYLYVALCINENASSSGLTFTVTDDDGDVHTATKAAPSGGFKNGKYYYSSDATELTWQTKLVKPTITNITNVDYAGEFGPDPIKNFYYLLPVNFENPVEITISGTSNGYWFSADYDNAIIHLNNLTATHDSNYFINTANLTLDISGANSITCKNEAQAIQVNGTLKLSGNGTLTVTANTSDRYGLYASSNYQDGNNSDASVLAAPGYAVTRSATTDNLDGTYTWTYTVTPAINGKFSVSSTKQVYFANGNLQATYDGSSWSWAFAANQWDYVGNAAANNVITGNGTVSANGTVDLFGWSTSSTYLGIHNSTESSNYSGSFADWGNHADVKAGIGTGWRTLSQAEWNYVFNTRTVNGGTGNGHSYTVGKTVNSKQGVVIYPDNYTGAAYDESDWNNFEAAGCVFLPAAGQRSGSTFNYVGNIGYYWSSTIQNGQIIYGVNVGTNVGTDGMYSTFNGMSVRLVHDAN